MKFVNQSTRREYIRLMGLGLVSTQIPFISYGFTDNANSDYFGELYYKTISEISNLIASKQITSLALTAMMLERIEKYDIELNSYVTLMSEQAIEVAKKTFATRLMAKKVFEMQKFGLKSLIPFRTAFGQLEKMLQLQILYFVITIL